MHLSHAVVPKQNILSSQPWKSHHPSRRTPAVFFVLSWQGHVFVCVKTQYCAISLSPKCNNFYQASSESTKASPHKIDLHVATKDLGKKVDFSSRGFHFVFIHAVELMTQTGCAWQKKLVGLSCRTRGRHCTACKKILCKIYD